MKFYYQSELDNLSNETIKAVSDYTEETTSDDFLYAKDDEFRSLRNVYDKLYFLEDLAIDLKLKQFNLTDIQEFIVAYMFINDLFSKEYTDGVMELLNEL